MPALYAHLRFGEEVAKTLPAPLSSILERYPESFHLGTQGADVLCYHRPLKANELTERASYLHTLSGNDFFLAQAKRFTAFDGETYQEKATNNGAYTAYLCGFLCHFTLDAVTHAYIDERSTDDVTHGKMESEFDKIILRLDGKPIRGYNTATPIINANGARESASIVLDVPEKNLALCIKTMRKINGWFSNRCEGFHSFAHFLLKIVGKERQFGDMFLHKKDDPLCIESNEYLLNKWKTAQATASALIQQFFTQSEDFVKSGKLKNELFRYDFSGILNSEE